MTYILSLDVGTSGVRAALFEGRGDQAPGASSSSQRQLQPNQDFAELDPDALVAEVLQTIDALPFASRPVTHIAISTFWHSLLGVDSFGRPTTPVLTWADTRAARHVELLRQRFDEPEIHRVTGCRFHSSYWPAKLLWLKEARPESFARTSQWLGFPEYLSLRLFGVAGTSISIASATGVFNQRTCEWEESFISELGISPAQLPSLANSELPQLKTEYRERWPSLHDARLVTMIGDGAANNIGGGCSTANNIALMVGTSGAMRAVYSGDPPESLPKSLWSYRVDARRVVVGGALSDGGGLIRWLRDLMQVESGPKLEATLAAFEPDAHGLTILPFWSGERSTHWSSETTGAILGLTQATTREQIIRAALESISYRFALIARALDAIVPGAAIVATGNALRSSPAWLQIITDVLGRTMSVGGAAEASMRGAALLALESVGKIGSIEEVQLSIDQIIEPDMSRHAVYQRALARQEEFYGRLFVN